MVYKLGVDSLSEVKIVSGKKLLKEGIEFLPKAALKQVWYKNKLWNIKKWIFPPDYAYNKHRRRRFSTRMIHILKKYGKKRFNQELIRAYYGYRIGFKFSYKNLKRYQINSALVPEICKALSIPKRDIKVLWKGGNSLYYRGSITPFLKKGTPQYEALYPKIKRVIKRGLWDEFLTSLTISKGCPIPNLSEKNLKKQLEYRGFVPLEKYPKYNPDKYCYIMANRLIEGKEYIYPAKFTHNYKLMKKGFPIFIKNLP